MTNEYYEEWAWCEWCGKERRAIARVMMMHNAYDPATSEMYTCDGSGQTGSEYEAFYDQRYRADLSHLKAHGYRYG